MFVMPITRTAHRHAYNGQARDLSRAFDRLFDDTVERVFTTTKTATRQPALDLRETDQSYSVQLDLPGVAKEDVKVTIDGKRVSIEAAARSTVQTIEGERLLVRERSATAYARSFTLPVEVDESASQARLENGVLSLTLTKKVRPATQLTIG
ncbi:Hsp20/alpha crystallin family protein [Methylibium sp.]|uniref:Hsp20/alpha crystallin family protein n=1 Tax=Methylibium sp. TaxID=2067992 RepID=UPI003D14A17C